MTLNQMLILSILVTICALHVQVKSHPTSAHNCDDHLNAYTTRNVYSSQWASEHREEIRRMAQKMRVEFNSYAHGGQQTLPATYSLGSGTQLNFEFTGKTVEELDSLTKQLTEQMIEDMKSGKLRYTQIMQPNWFENQAAYKLEALDHHTHHDQSHQHDTHHHTVHIQPTMQTLAQMQANNERYRVRETSNRPKLFYPSSYEKDGISFVQQSDQTLIPVYPDSYFDHREDQQTNERYVYGENKNVEPGVEPGLSHGSQNDRVYYKIKCKVQVPNKPCQQIRVPITIDNIRMHPSGGIIVPCRRVTGTSSVSGSQTYTSENKLQWCRMITRSSSRSSDIGSVRQIAVVPVDLEQMQTAGHSTSFHHTGQSYVPMHREAQESSRHYESEHDVQYRQPVPSVHQQSYESRTEYENRQRTEEGQRHVPFHTYETEEKTNERDTQHRQSNGRYYPGQYPYMQSGSSVREDEESIEEGQKHIPVILHPEPNYEFEDHQQTEKETHYEVPDNTPTTSHSHKFQSNVNETEYSRESTYHIPTGHQQEHYGHESERHDTEYDRRRLPVHGQGPVQSQGVTEEDYDVEITRERHRYPGGRRTPTSASHTYRESKVEQSEFTHSGRQHNIDLDIATNVRDDEEHHETTYRRPYVVKPVHEVQEERTEHSEAHYYVNGKEVPEHVYRSFMEDKNRRGYHEIRHSQSYVPSHVHQVSTREEETEHTSEEKQRNYPVYPSHAEFEESRRREEESNRRYTGTGIHYRPGYVSSASQSENDDHTQVNTGGYDRRPHYTSTHDEKQTKVEEESHSHIRPMFVRPGSTTHSQDEHNRTETTHKYHSETPDTDIDLTSEHKFAGTDISTHDIHKYHTTRRPHRVNVDREEESIERYNTTHDVFGRPLVGVEVDVQQQYETWNYNSTHDVYGRPRPSSHRVEYEEEHTTVYNITHDIYGHLRPGVVVDNQKTETSDYERTHQVHVTPTSRPRGQAVIHEKQYTCEYNATHEIYGELRPVGYEEHRERDVYSFNETHDVLGRPWAHGPTGLTIEYEEEYVSAYNATHNIYGRLRLRPQPAVIQTAVEEDHQQRESTDVTVHHVSTGHTVDREEVFNCLYNSTHEIYGLLRPVAFYEQKARETYSYNMTHDKYGRPWVSGPTGLTVEYEEEYVSVYNSTHNIYGRLRPRPRPTEVQKPNDGFIHVTYNETYEISGRPKPGSQTTQYEEHTESVYNSTHDVYGRLLPSRTVTHREDERGTAMYNQTHDIYGQRTKYGYGGEKQEVERYRYNSTHDIYGRPHGYRVGYEEERYAEYNSTHDIHGGQYPAGHRQYQTDERVKMYNSTHDIYGIRRPHGFKVEYEEETVLMYNSTHDIHGIYRPHGTRRKQIDQGEYHESGYTVNEDELQRREGSYDSDGQQREDHKYPFEEGQYRIPSAPPSGAIRMTTIDRGDLPPTIYKEEDEGDDSDMETMPATVHHAPSSSVLQPQPTFERVPVSTSYSRPYSAPLAPIHSGSQRSTEKVHRIELYPSEVNVDRSQINSQASSQPTSPIMVRPANTMGEFGSSSDKYGTGMQGSRSYTSSSSTNYVRPTYRESDETQQVQSVFSGSEGYNREHSSRGNTGSSTSSFGSHGSTSSTRGYGNSGHQYGLSSSYNNRQHSTLDSASLTLNSNHDDVQQIQPTATLGSSQHRSGKLEDFAGSDGQLQVGVFDLGNSQTSEEVGQRVVGPTMSNSNTFSISSSHSGSDGQFQIGAFDNGQKTEDLNQETMDLTLENLNQQRQQNVFETESIQQIRTQQQQAGYGQEVENLNQQRQQNVFDTESIQQIRAQQQEVGNGQESENLNQQRQQNVFDADTIQQTRVQQSQAGYGQESENLNQQRQQNVFDADTVQQTRVQQSQAGYGQESENLNQQRQQNIFDADTIQQTRVQQSQAGYGQESENLNQQRQQNGFDADTIQQTRVQQSQAGYGQELESLNQQRQQNIFDADTIQQTRVQQSQAGYGQESENLNQQRQQNGFDADTIQQTRVQQSQAGYGQELESLNQQRQQNVFDADTIQQTRVQQSQGGYGQESENLNQQRQQNVFDADTIQQTRVQQSQAGYGQESENLNQQRQQNVFDADTIQQTRVQQSQAGYGQESENLNQQRQQNGFDADTIQQTRVQQSQAGYGQELESLNQQRQQNVFDADTIQQTRVQQSQGGYGQESENLNQQRQQNVFDADTVQQTRLQQPHAGYGQHATQYSGSYSASSTYGGSVNNHQQMQNLQEVQAQQVEEKQETEGGFWSKLGKKAKDFFG